MKLWAEDRSRWWWSGVLGSSYYFIIMIIGRNPAAKAWVQCLGLQLMMKMIMMYGDELMVMWWNDYYYIWWDEKKKGWEHQLHQNHYYCEKSRIISPVDSAGRGKPVIIWLLPACSMEIFYHQIPTESKEKNILSKLEYFLT